MSETGDVQHAVEYRQALAREHARAPKAWREDFSAWDSYIGALVALQVEDWEEARHALGNAYEMWRKSLSHAESDVGVAAYRDKLAVSGPKALSWYLGQTWGQFVSRYYDSRDAIVPAEQRSWPYLYQLK